MNLGRDLRKFRKQNNWTQKQISEKLGIPSTTWASWENGQSQPKLDMLCILRQMGLEISGLTTNFSPVAPQEVIDIKIKEVSEKSTKKESSTITPPQELNQNDFVVPILDQSLSAGKGQILPDDDNPIGYIAVPKELKRYGNKLAAIYVNGDSMEPTLQRGDLVVCDSCGWDGDGIYALRMDGCGYVKRLARKPGKLVVISDNPKYETWEETTESEAVSIIGRVHYTLKHVD